MKTRLLSTFVSFAFAVALLGERPAEACTNVLVTRGASADGATLLTYSADSDEMYGELKIIPARQHPEGAMRDVFEWETGKYLGRIKEVPYTYKVMGNMNEFQLTLAETTFGGRKELEGPSGLLDYGSLIYLALERAKTAREAIKVITELVAEYGYSTSGESFSIADPKEAWILDLIGKGAGQKGAVWVARRIPDGYISAHANQSRIRQFPLNDPENALYSKDVISFAREKGWYTRADKDFSFADTYAPMDFESVRFCEARVWSVFRRAAPSRKLGPEYAEGTAPDKRLPLWTKPDKKLSVQDVMGLMRDHFEGTGMDLSKGVGAGPYSCPYRWRPLKWDVDGQRYIHERSISTQQTFFSFVAQMRSWMPDAVGGVLWFGVDDTYTTVYVPMYAGINEAPKHYAAGVANLNTFSWDAAFWVFNWVSNYSYSRWSDMVGDIQKVQGELEGQFLAQAPETEKAALELYKTSPEQARLFLTAYSAKQGELTIARWRQLGERLVVKYLDGGVKNEMGKVTNPKYPESWYREIVRENGEYLKYRTAPPAQPQQPQQPKVATPPAP